MVDYNVAIYSVDVSGTRRLLSRSVENIDYVRALNPTDMGRDRVVKVWRVDDTESEAVYEARGWNIYDGHS